MKEQNQEKQYSGWYLRDFDFLPEPLENKRKKLTPAFMNIIEQFKVFETKEEAIKASILVRTVMGMPIPHELTDMLLGKPSIDYKKLYEKEKNYSTTLAFDYNNERTKRCALEEKVGYLWHYAPFWLRWMYNRKFNK